MPSANALLLNHAHFSDIFKWLPPDSIVAQFIVIVITLLKKRLQKQLQEQLQKTVTILLLTLNFLRLSSPFLVLQNISSSFSLTSLASSSDEILA